MKTIFSTRNTVSILLASLILIAGFIACSKNNDDAYFPNMYTTSGSGSGGQHVPPVTTSGSATLTGTYNKETNSWQYSLNWTSLSSAATVVQIHGPATIGINGNLLFTLVITTPGINGSAVGNITLTHAQEDFLLSGETYFAILTSTNIGGEIRGQISATPQ